MGFGAADVGLQLGQFGLQCRQFLPTGLFLAVEAGNFAAGAGNSSLCFSQCPLRFCLRSLFRLQVFFCGGDGVADIAEFGIGGWGGCGKSIWGDKGGAEQQSGEFVHKVGAAGGEIDNYIFIFNDLTVMPCYLDNQPV